ncbi:MAG: DUF2065 domain-containing protein [Rhodobiaceae bacterium]|jgi:uncharacterized protein YjeT (DUF2065 family)|nr:DUF2065 domain-containing protein [Rhodobiaceae bacterium]MBT5640049.1 DUF2065 domain-containing protein [Rhodobiaceae bacterium]MBT6223666.1 DUF2065 domain-containing protein [Rhodobiaceae bacterium]|tara:strand:- start:53 stop:235 length:183 start_codon:yes stop_codon:yes gene_type:complete
MNEFFIAIGLVFVIEGFLYAMYPVYMKKLIQLMLDYSDISLRYGGILFVIIGLFIIWVAK